MQLNDKKEVDSTKMEDLINIYSKMQKEQKRQATPKRLGKNKNINLIDTIDEDMEEDDYKYRASISRDIENISN